MTPPAARAWRLCDADWNHWPDGADDAAIWPAVRGGGFAGVEVGVYRCADELTADRVAARTALAHEHALPVAAVLLSLPAERWPAGALSGPPTVRAALAAEAAGCAAACAAWGLDTLGVWPGADGGRLESVVEGLRAVRDAAAEHGVRVAVEAKPGTAVAGVDGALALAAAVPGTGALLDTGHSWAAGEDPAEVVRRLGNLLWHVHLGDAAAGDADADLPLGRLHDPAPLVAALDATGYAGVATLDLYGAVSSGALSGVEAGRESYAALTGRRR